jgi:hypothetical protein
VCDGVYAHGWAAARESTVLGYVTLSAWAQRRTHPTGLFVSKEYKKEGTFCAMPISYYGLTVCSYEGSFFKSAK